jgi:hypothetical protein
VFQIYFSNSFWTKLVLLNPDSNSINCQIEKSKMCLAPKFDKIKLVFDEMHPPVVHASLTKLPRYDTHKKQFSNLVYVKRSNISHLKKKERFWFAFKIG